MKFHQLSIFLFLLCSTPFYGQTTSYSEIEKEILVADSLLFNEGFNNCNMSALEQAADKNLEFYHDISGVTMGKENFKNGIKKNICSIDYKPIRELNLEDHHVFPLRENGEIYGAVQSGTHRFYALKDDNSKFLTSTARFTNLWLKKSDHWKLQKVMSYDHKTPKIDDTASEYQHWVEKNLREHKVPALATAVLKNHKLFSLKVTGELYGKEKAPLDAIFNVASLTKPIITMITLELVNNGQWDLDTPVYKYWVDPDLHNEALSRKLTTRHILSHQSGFPNWRWENQSKKLEFIYEPGKGFGYSGEGFEYLKNALESKFKTSIENLADSIIFKPLGMKNTSFTWNKIIEEDKFARWHDAEGKNTYEIYKNTSASAADDLLTTISDYAKFAEYVLTKIASNKNLYNDMVTRTNGTEHSVAMGLGWEILPGLKNDEYAILHTGGDEGVRTLIMLLPETGEGLILFTNGDNGNQLFFNQIEHNLSLGREIIGKA
ncbi:serine hydrolase [Christiangramia sabulilitoris]|uniref:Serine hydrolase n=1 Tax=Christiangramia sabulilitoris TaxID=2583991 RepID=A0A550I786_9FLAO|nr:serine hydrolase [Christiangramia sabulilitoris]TRO66832.1 serine hydrolase [Christiangramia sabulilitoris]